MVDRLYGIPAVLLGCKCHSYSAVHHRVHSMNHTVPNCHGSCLRHEHACMQPSTTHTTSTQNENLSQNVHSFTRIQSTACEQQNFEGVISELDPNLLTSLALGHVCLVYDCGSRITTWGVPRAAWYGVEFVRYCVTRLWLGREAAARCGALVRGACSCKVHYCAVFRVCSCCLFWGVCAGCLQVCSGVFSCPAGFRGKS